MPGYKFVVSGSNVALGIYPDMVTALNALEMSCQNLKTKYAPTAEYASLTGTVKGGQYIDFTIVAVKESVEAGKMF